MLVDQYTNNSDNTKFTGITKKMKHHIFIDGKKDVCELLDRTKPKNTYAGELPPVLFYMLPKENKGQNIREIYKNILVLFDKVKSDKEWTGRKQQGTFFRREQEYNLNKPA